MNSKDNKGVEKGKKLHSTQELFRRVDTFNTFFFRSHFDGDDYSISPDEKAGERLKKTIGMPGFIFIVDMSLS